MKTQIDRHTGLQPNKLLHYLGVFRRDQDQVQYKSRTYDQAVSKKLSSVILSLRQWRYSLGRYNPHA
jgi:hypothetical protein